MYSQEEDCKPVKSMRAAGRLFFTQQWTADRKEE